MTIRRRSTYLTLFVGLFLIVLIVAGCSRPVTEVKGTSDLGDVPPIEVAESDWAAWRGPNGNGHARGPLPPLTWSRSENVRWKAVVPGEGHASPIVVGDQVFVATATDKPQQQLLLAYDRNTGKELWKRELHEGGFMHIHGKNSQASATPACDGRYVFAACMVEGGIWVTAVDREGNIAWQTKAGPFTSRHGYGSSPLLHESLVIVQGDNHGSGFLTALNRQTGEIVWRTRRKSDSSFATPIIARLNGRAELLLSGHLKVTSYDPASGDVLWSSEGPASTTANTLSYNNELVFASGGYPQRNVMAIRADGSGEVLWRQALKAYVPSPLLLDDRLLVVQDNGVMRSLSLEKGDVQWQKRLGGDCSASPVYCAGHVFTTNESGTTFVIKPGQKCEVVAENSMGETMMATPVICGGRLYLRTRTTLYCIGAPAAE